MCRGLRLFERLQQSVGGLVVHVIGVFDDEKPARTLERAEVGFTFEFTYRSDADDLFVGPHHCDVRVLAPNQPSLIIVVVIEGWKGRVRNSFAGGTLVTRLETATSFAV